MKRKKLYIGLFLVLLLCVGVSLGSGAYMLDYSLTPVNRGRNEKESLEYMRSAYPQIVNWMDSLYSNQALRDTFITNTEGVRLHAYYASAPKPTPRTAVIVHGYTDNAIRMMMIGYLYHKDLQCNIMLPDLQNHGQSEGEVMQMGWKDRLDVMQWIGVSRQLFGGDADTTRIVVHGISMGAATTMCVSGEVLPANIKCFVEDCGYTSVWDEFSGELKSQFNLPDFPVLYSASFLCQLRYGWNFKEASPQMQIAKCQLPMLFIHGGGDAFVPTSMVYTLYETKPGIKELWVEPDVTHAQMYKDHPEKYTGVVSRFVNRYL